MGAKLPDINTLISAGINPKNGLPIKFSSGDKCMLKENIKMQLRIKDEAEFVNRFTWYNLPLDLSSEEFERLLYYKGQLVIFFEETTNKFFACPFALDGEIDAYGRYTVVKPIPMTSGKDETTNSLIANLFSKKKLKVIYSIKSEEEIQKLKLGEIGIIIRDYTNQLSQVVIPRVTTADALLDVMAEMIPFMRTRLLIGTGVKGMRVNDADQYHNVLDANKDYENASLTGRAYTPIVGSLEFQELGEKGGTNAEEYMMSLQSLDNFRKESMGIPSTGVYNKKAHMLQSEQQLNGTNVDLVLQDALNQRQNTCNIFNSIFATGMWVDVSETISCVDANGDGVAYDNNTPDNASQEVGGNDYDE